MPSATGSPLRISIVAAVVSALGYLGWLAWDQDVDVRASDGYVTGPYQAWQIIGLIIVLIALAIYVGLRQCPFEGSLAIALVLTICFAVDAATNSDGDGLWVIGAAMIAIGSFAGGLLIACAAGSVGARLTARCRTN